MREKKVNLRIHARKMFNSLNYTEYSIIEKLKEMFKVKSLFALDSTQLKQLLFRLSKETLQREQAIKECNRTQTLTNNQEDYEDFI